MSDATGFRRTARAGQLALPTRPLGRSLIAAKHDVEARFASPPRQCFDMATELLTDRGWRRFTALDRTERVATLNQSTWVVEYHRPIDYFEYRCDEPLFLVESPFVNLAVTGEHWLYVAAARRGGFRLIRASDAAAHSLRFLRSAHWHGAGDRDSARGTEVVAESVRLADAMKRAGSGGYGGGHGGVPAVRLKTRRVPLAPFLALIGRYLAAGVCYAAEGGPGLVVLPDATGIAELAAACGFRARARLGRVVVEDPHLYDYVAAIGETHSKRIPRHLLDLPSESLTILRDALFHNRRRFATPSPYLAGDVQELLLKTGASGNVALTRPGRYAISVVDAWTAVVRRGPRPAPEPYKGRVWCVSVANHVVYVRRQGIPVWTGNCPGGI